MAQLPDRFPANEANAAMSFLRDVQARFASDPSVYAEFCGLLVRFRKGETADSRAVVAGAEALLQGQPDLIERFNAYHPRKHNTKPTGEYVTAVERQNRDRHRTAVDADGDIGPQFLQWVKHADAGLYDRFIALLTYVDMDVKMDAHAIYDRAVPMFGSAHSDLLRGFAEFLPTEHDLPRWIAKQEPEEHRPSPKRKAAAVAVAVAADAASKPTRAKKPRADDHKSRPTSIDGGSKSGSGGGASTFREAWEFETRYSKLVATIRRTKELLEELGSPGPHAGRAFEDLFPSHECREVLRSMYEGQWEPIQEALEDGERAHLALRRIMGRLWEKENLAITVAMERRDRTRARDRLTKLVEGVLEARRNQASQSTGDRGGPCARPAGGS